MTGAALSSGAANARGDNPQPFTGWWKTPSGELLRVKQWGQQLIGATADGRRELKGTVRGDASAEATFGGGDPVSLQLDGAAETLTLPGEGKCERYTPHLVVICGPSGVGKGTLLKRLLDEHPGQFGFSVSHTTRAPRAGERDGADYHFAPKDEVQRGIDAGEFLEFAHVHGNIYGTSKAAVEAVRKQGKIAVLDIDVQGAQKVRASGVPFVGIFIKPPSWDELERRLRGRGTEDEERILKRLKNARGEVDFCDSSGFFWYELVNDDLEAAYRGLVGCIAQSMRPPALPPVAWDANPAPQCQVVKSA